jgi:Flp pilus assembly protein TadD/peroxiredoxin
MKRDTRSQPGLSRRAILKSLGAAPLFLRPSPFFGTSLLSGLSIGGTQQNPTLPFSDIRLTPHYPAPSPLADVLRLVAPGSDEYITEQYAFEIEALLAQWGDALKKSVGDRSSLAKIVSADIESTLLSEPHEAPIRSGFGVDVLRRTFSPQTTSGQAPFLQQISGWLTRISLIETAEFEIYGIAVASDSPLSVHTEIRYDVVASSSEDRREERVGSWRIDWVRDAAQTWKAHRWIASEETVSVAHGPFFVDVTAHALSKEESYQKQMLRGADDWRTVLDGAIGTDVYGNNGIAAGDYNNDGFDDFYVCQAAGLPNRLYRNRGDGTFEDVTEKAGVGVLDNSACALFADFDNRGLQDLLVVCGTGPLLFTNQGDGTFHLKPDAFKFAHPPQGTFTHAAVADYDRDGRLDIYFCMYMYYLGLDQYHYPVPYYDARNGPPNCLFHNEGNGNFIERTDETGLNADNNRYSFACAWGDSNGNGLPDIFVVNDFGSSQLYRNNGNGTFTVVSHEANVEGVGAGMSCAWCDYDNDGHQDVYVPSMWEAAGQRVSEQKQFHENTPESIRKLYQRHARGNALYRNGGAGKFENVAQQAAVEMGRWSWSSDFWDFDHDGYSDLYVTNGYISSQDRNDLASFFWRQVVAKSSDDATGALAYERGWNAINELIRSDHTWHGYARNVMFANNRDGTFSEVSGPSGLDFIEDSRSFALADLDHDGRLEVILKNRNAPQIRILHNEMKEIGNSIAFRLCGHQSNRDAIGASVTVDAGALRQTKYLQAGTGFLAQHSKELFFGIGKADTSVNATIRWPNGLIQLFADLPINHRIEIEEGSPTFVAQSFAAPPPGFLRAAIAPAIDARTEPVETWLIDPLKAPQFSLPDLDGALHDLRTLQGSPVLLAFWSASAESSVRQLQQLHQHRSVLAGTKLHVLAINIDQPATQPAARKLAMQLGFSFPILFATEEMAGIYNIVYRHLFDRRRDLGIPTSLLLDPEGMIVKVYQGPFDVRILHDDLSVVPTTTADRTRKATPFAGSLFQAAFVRNDFTYGVAMYQHGYLGQAAESFRQALAKRPDDPDAYYNLGTLALRSNDFQQARLYLEQTLKFRPNYPEAWNNLGMIAAQQGQPDQAIQSFRQSVQLRPSYATAWLNLGNVYRRQRDFGKSEEALRQALNLQPDNPEVSYSLGMLYAQQDQTQSAHDYLEKALSQRPDYPEALSNLGVLYVKERDYPKAEEQFKTGMRIAPNYDQSYLNLARLYAMEGDNGKARDVLQQLLHLQPENSAAQQTLERLQ